MSESSSNSKQVVVKSTRFGELVVPEDSIIVIPSGLIGFPRHTRFIMIDHKPPFSWLHSVDDPNLAFVVVDGFQFGDKYQVNPPIGDTDSDLKEEDEYAILVIVTVRPNPHETTANLKAPVFVNIRNRKGVQVIFDDQRYSTRFPLWSEDEKSEKPSDGSDQKKSEQKKS